MDDVEVAELLKNFERMGTLKYPRRLDEADRKAAPALLAEEFPDTVHHDILRSWGSLLAAEAHARGVEAQFVGAFADVSANPWRFEDIEVPRAIARLKARLEREHRAKGGAAVVYTYQPNPQEQQVIDLIKEAGCRMTTPQVVAALEKTVDSPGEAATKSRLATLIRAQILDSQTDSYGKGYGLKQWSIPK